VTIDERGPRGPRGKTGKTGPAGPGAIRLAVKSTNGLVTKKSKPVAGSKLTVEVICDPANYAQVYINENVPGSPFTVTGSGSWNGSAGTGEVLFLNGSGDPTVKTFGDTSKTVAIAQTGDPHSVEFISSQDTIEANVLVAQGSHMFSVLLAGFRDPGSASCFAQALVTPAG
jgi:hypothetical protein